MFVMSTKLRTELLDIIY